MSLILDQWARPAASNMKFARASETWQPERPWVPTRLDDIGKLITPYDRRVLVAVSRLMMENWGPMTAIGRQIPMFAVGNAWVPSNQSKSPRFKNKAEGVIREEFAPIADIRGRSLTKLVYDVVHEVIRDGESFILKTSYENGFPALQIIPNHRVGQRREEKEGIVSSGNYKGAKIQDGIITNRLGQVIAYRVLGDTEKEDEDISAIYVEHVFDSDYSEGVRGYPAASHGLNDARDSLQSHEWERFNLLFRSAHTIIENSISGAPDENPGGHFGTTPSGASAATRAQMVLGGLIRHLQAGSGSKLESLKHETPGEIYESFGDRMIRKICAGVPWPASLVWEATGQGTAERRDIEQARRTLADIQDTVCAPIARCVGYATAKLQKKGRIEESRDWWRWTFSYPARFTIDDGRTIKMYMELWRAGVMSDEDLLVELGKDPDAYWPRKFHAARKKLEEFNGIAGDSGLDKRYMGMFTPNEMAPVEEEEEPKKKPE